MLAMRWHQSSQERVPTDACQGMWPTDATGGATVQLTGETTPGGRWQSQHHCLMRSNICTGVGGRDRRAEGTNGGTRCCNGRKDGVPAACELPESASSCCRCSRRLRPFSPKEGAAGQRPNKSSPELSDQFGRVQRT
jgi:hypothetical protein